MLFNIHRGTLLCSVPLGLPPTFSATADSTSLGLPELCIEVASGM